MKYNDDYKLPSRGVILLIYTEDTIFCILNLQGKIN